MHKAPVYIELSKVIYRPGAPMSTKADMQYIMSKEPFDSIPTDQTVMLPVAASDLDVDASFSSSVYHRQKTEQTAKSDGERSKWLTA